MKTGDRIGWLFEESDGSTFVVGSWVVPHDSDYAALNDTDMMFHLLHALARQDPLEVVRVEVRRMEDMPGVTDG